MSKGKDPRRIAPLTNPWSARPAATTARVSRGSAGEAPPRHAAALFMVTRPGTMPYPAFPDGGPPDARRQVAKPEKAGYHAFSIIVQGLTIARLFSTDRLQGMLAPAAGAAPERP